MTKCTGIPSCIAVLACAVSAVYSAADTRILLIDGAQAPGGLGTYVAGETSSAAIAGDAIAIATAVGGAGDVMMVSGCDAQFRLVATEGEALPNTNIVSGLRGLGGPVTNRFGLVAFPVDSVLAGNPNASTDDLVLGSRGGIDALILGDGDAAPGGDGQLYAPIMLSPAINDAGLVAYSARLFNTSGGSSDDEAVYRFDPAAGTVVEIARKGGSAPGGGTFTGTAFQSNQVFDSPFISLDGRVAFKAAINGTVFGDNGVFVGDGSSTQSFFRFDDPLPGSGSPRFGSSAGFDFNAAGELVAVVNFAGTSGSFDAVYRSDGRDMVRIAGSGDIAPGGLPFRTFGTAVKQDASGTALFSATVTASGSIPNGIYVGDGSSITQLAIVGGQAPNGRGAFSFMGAYTMSPNGNVAFIAFAGGGVNIYRQRNGNVQELLSTLDTVAGIDITSLTLAGSGFGQGAGINDRGEVLFNFTLADGRGGVGLTGVQPGVGMDSDADGVPDLCDNCTLSANVEQFDADLDGYGNVCDADFNQDCAVNAIDLGMMRAAFFTANDVIDLNNDGVVNAIDLGLLRAQFFAPPGPAAAGACGSRALLR